MSIGHLPTGSRGFDANTRISSADAARFYTAGYRFAVRYVRRGPHHSYDLAPLELAALLRAGLAVMVVQHVANPGWLPNEALGRVYGAVAADEAGRAGYAEGATLWCDLEGVHPQARASDVIGYCNAWHDAVKRAGFDPGLYVGDSPGLSGEQLYYRLKFKRYWAAYNLNRDLYPVVRGVQMRQHVAGAADRVPLIDYEIDVDVIGQDALGDSPVLLLAPGDR